MALRRSSEAGAVRRGLPSMEDVVKLIEHREDLRSGALLVGRELIDYGTAVGLSIGTTWSGSG